MTDQHPGINPTHQPGLRPQVPSQYSGPGGQQPSHFNDVTDPTSSARKHRKPIIIATIAGVLSFGLVVLAGLAVYDTFFKEDPGIAACKALRDNRDSFVDPEGDDEFTEEQYREIRKMFEDSKYEDIREHGKALVDLGWQLSNLPEGAAASALAFLGEFIEHATGLQTACADQGIVINLLDR